MKEKTPITLIASIVTVFIFLTGIQTLPSLIAKFTGSPEIGPASASSSSGSVALVIIGVVLILFAFLIVGRYLNCKTLPQLGFIGTNEHRIALWFLWAVLGTGFVFLLCEFVYGTGNVLTKENKITPTILIFSGVGMFVMSYWIWDVDGESIETKTRKENTPNNANSADAKKPRG